MNLFIADFEGAEALDFSQICLPTELPHSATWTGLCLLDRSAPEQPKARPDRRIPDDRQYELEFVFPATGPAVPPQPLEEGGP